jgi:hypothetical protein
MTAAEMQDIVAYIESLEPVAAAPGDARAQRAAL